MTAFFVKKYKSTNKCDKCIKGKLSGYSLCASHLERAKLRFRNWSAERRAEKRCISCDCKSYCGFLRCKKHTQYNRKMCRAWTKKHPERAHLEWLERKAKHDAAGTCRYCKAHPPVVPGRVKCINCVAPATRLKIMAQAVSVLL